MFGATVGSKNALGARGIDRIETVASQGTAVAYPVYDGHGNMVATLTKQGSGYQIGNRRSFGAWGDVRQGATTGDPKGRYVANLGHVDDDESGLTYMRARYYEASSGRFISEDPARNGLTWFVYGSNNPTNFVDYDGRRSLLASLGQVVFTILGTALLLGASVQFHWAVTPIQNIRATEQAMMGVALLALGLVLANPDVSIDMGMALLAGIIESRFYSMVKRNIGLEVANAAVGSKTLAANAVNGAFLYSMVCWAFLMAMALET